jgi:hypothetical protein
MQNCVTWASTSEFPFVLNPLMIETRGIIALHAAQGYHPAPEPTWDVGQANRPTPGMQVHKVKVPPTPTKEPMP